MNQVTSDASFRAGWTVETTACPLCNSTAARDTRYVHPPFAVKACADCSLFYLSPRLTREDARRLYQSDTYFSGGDGASGYASYQVQEDSLRATFRTLLKTLERQGVCGGSLLEVGCGPGYLLDEARRYFPERAGVELSPATAREAELRSGARIELDLDDFDATPAFDCIIATHVIEHIYDPVPFVQNMARRLKPGGSLVLAAPHMGSIFRRVMGNRWPSFKYPEHVSFFDAETLSALLVRAGLDVAESVPYPHAFPLSLVLSKLGIKVGGVADRISITLPATTVCCRATRPGGAT